MIGTHGVVTLAVARCSPGLACTQLLSYMWWAHRIMILAIASICPAACAAQEQDMLLFSWHLSSCLCCKSSTDCKQRDPEASVRPRPQTQLWKRPPWPVSRRRSQTMRTALRCAGTRFQTRRQPTRVLALCSCC